MRGNIGSIVHVVDRQGCNTKLLTHENSLDLQDEQYSLFGDEAQKGKI